MVIFSAKIDFGGQILSDCFHVETMMVFLRGFKEFCDWWCSKLKNGYPLRDYFFNLVLSLAKLFSISFAFCFLKSSYSLYVSFLHKFEIAIYYFQLLLSFNDDLCWSLKSCLKRALTFFNVLFSRGWWVEDDYMKWGI